jgi:UDP-D-galactose:(glucosyl)LPS alpha-1,3-D-galactosyltransferase
MASLVSPDDAGAGRRDLAPIVCGIDDGYLQPMLVLMASLAVAHADATPELRLIVLHQALSEESRRAILSLGDRLNLAAELRTVPAPDTRYLVSRWISEAVYLRLSIPDVLPDEPVVLYLDTDVLVLRDLRPLLRSGLSGTPLAAVRDPQGPFVGMGFMLPGWWRLGLTRTREYFNSGVLLIDQAECRRREIFEKARRFLTEHQRHVRFWDQDALNWAADDNWLRLERCWNTMALSPLTQRENFIYMAEAVMPLAELIAEEGTAAVLHFAGPDKPWNDDYPPSGIRDRYRRFLTDVAGPVR